MLAAGTLVRPVDVFDLVMHGAPWLLLGLRLHAVAAARPTGQPAGAMNLGVRAPGRRPPRPRPAGRTNQARWDAPAPIEAP